MNTLILSRDSFFSMLRELIQSGVTFTATEVGNDIHVEFTGGF